MGVGVLVGPGDWFVLGRSGGDLVGAQGLVKPGGERERMGRSIEVISPIDGRAAGVDRGG